MTDTIDNLSDLFDAIIDGTISLDDNLPSFGGDEPSCTVGVWSWDAISVMVGTCVDDLEIVSRHGDLYDYDTGDTLRPATEAQMLDSRMAESANGAGVIIVDGQRCYVI